MTINILQVELFFFLRKCNKEKKQRGGFHLPRGTYRHVLAGKKKCRHAQHHGRGDRWRCAGTGRRSVPVRVNSGTRASTSGTQYVRRIPQRPASRLFALNYHVISRPTLRPGCTHLHHRLQASACPVQYAAAGRLVRRREPAGCLLPARAERYCALAELALRLHACTRARP